MILGWIWTFVCHTKCHIPSLSGQKYCNTMADVITMSRTTVLKKHIKCKKFICLQFTASILLYIRFGSWLDVFLQELMHISCVYKTDHSKFEKLFSQGHYGFFHSINLTRQFDFYASPDIFYYVKVWRLCRTVKFGNSVFCFPDNGLSRRMGGSIIILVNKRSIPKTLTITQRIV